MSGSRDGELDPRSVQGCQTALLELGFDDFQSNKLAYGTDISFQRGDFAKARMEEVTKLGWDTGDILWHTWRHFDNFHQLWPLMDPLNDLQGLQVMFTSLGLDLAVRLLCRPNPQVGVLVLFLQLTLF